MAGIFPGSPTRVRPTAKRVMSRDISHPGLLLEPAGQLTVVALMILAVILFIGDQNPELRLLTVEGSSPWFSANHPLRESGDLCAVSPGRYHSRHPVLRRLLRHDPLPGREGAAFDVGERGPGES